MDTAREWLTTEYEVPDCLIAWDDLSRCPKHWRMFGSLRGSNRTMGKIGLSLTSPHLIPTTTTPKVAAQHSPFCIKWVHINPIINKKTTSEYISSPNKKEKYIYPLKKKSSRHAKTNQSKIPADPNSHNPILCRKDQFVTVIKKKIYTKESQMSEVSVSATSSVLVVIGVLLWRSSVFFWVCSFGLGFQTTTKKQSVSWQENLEFCGSLSRSCCKWANMACQEQSRQRSAAEPHSGAESNDDDRGIPRAKRGKGRT